MHGEGTLTCADGTAGSGLRSGGDFMENDNEPDHEAEEIRNEVKKESDAGSRPQKANDPEEKGLVSAGGVSQN